MHLCIDTVHYLRVFAIQKDTQGIYQRYLELYGSNWHDCLLYWRHLRYNVTDNFTISTYIMVHQCDAFPYQDSLPVACVQVTELPGDDGDYRGQ